MNLDAYHDEQLTDYLNSLDDGRSECDHCGDKVDELHDCGYHGKLCFHCMDSDHEYKAAYLTEMLDSVKKTSLIRCNLIREAIKKKDNKWALRLLERIEADMNNPNQT